MLNKNIVKHTAHTIVSQPNPDSKVYGANMGPIWGRQDPGGPHVGPMNFAIWVNPQKWLMTGNKFSASCSQRKI